MVDIHLFFPTASAVAHQDHLQFLEDIVPRAVPYKKVRATAAAKRATLAVGAKVVDAQGTAPAGKGKAPKGQSKLMINGNLTRAPQDDTLAKDLVENDENVQEDVDMEIS